MTLTRLFRAIGIVAFLVTLSSVRAADRGAAGEILPLLDAQAAAWNRGDIDGFMQTYAQTDDLRFASGDTVTYGWRSTLERYRKRYPDRAAMGTLAFHDLVVTELGPDAAIVFGRWQLTRVGDRPHGLFTLLVRRTPAGWRIFADHTSAAQ
ncbi:MAG: nuclear transport factor 2 family protein [Verrucomicrobia bacterium]|nr:nuclear transport factor 2 family protein [Verrucomicrobiota bacterium]